ncbi:MAG: Flp pilus assembly complex ATPase component TadA [Gammaproteobacteria bacterium]|nr:Flp pilus assembly complex ATPase component TadA [Gammaproteobacteria bacterium]MCP5196874.1 Flp pilus assembly complex ATPase component TadA [Gammaproteobacteria bacterium]
MSVPTQHPPPSGLSSETPQASDPSAIRQHTASSSELPAVRFESIAVDPQAPPKGRLGQPSGALSTSETGLEIAKFLIEDGIITDQQLAYAMRVRAKLSTEKSLLSVLNEIGYVSLEQQRITLRKHRISVRIGALLVELGFLREQDLRAALALQRESGQGKKLGDILLENHFIEENKLLEVLADQLGFPQVKPDLSDVDRKLMEKANPNWFLQRHFLPLRVENNQVLVAFADPLDRRARQEAAWLFSAHDLVPLIASKRVIRETIEAYKRHYQEPIAPTAQVDDTSQVIKLVDTMLLDAVQARASDIHVEPMRNDLRIRFRCDGVLEVYKTLDKQLAATFVNRIKILGKADIAERRRHQDGHIAFEDFNTGRMIDIRVSIYITVHGEKIVLRLLRRTQLVPLDQIRMFPRTLGRFYEDVLDLPSGIILITGPTGTGKTTTLYSAVNYLNSIDRCVTTAEDPVEFIIEGIAQCSLNPKIDLTFETTLPHIMRQDPDVIVLGEIRDRFSAEAAIHAALTGHKVLTTFHTEDSTGALLRLMNMNIETFLIASTVVAVLAQRLLRQICPHCAEPYQPNSSELQRLGYKHHDLEGAAFQQGRGCPLCRHTGYQGRIGVFELLVLNLAVKDAVLQKCTAHAIRQVSLESTGMVTLLEDGLAKASRGETTLAETFRYLPRLEKPRPLAEIKRLVGIA